MGLANGFFWNLTPRLFQMLVEQYQQRERRKNLRAGLVASVFLNTNRTKSTDRIWVASDFFEEAPSRNEVQTEQEMMRAMDAWVTRTKGVNRC